MDTDTILCTRCPEVVGEIEEGDWGVEAMIQAQTEEWGDLEEKAAKEKHWLVNKEGILF